MATVKQIIKKLDAAAEALDQLFDLLPEDLQFSRVGDDRTNLRSRLIEYSDYLERATWAKGGQK